MSSYFIPILPDESGETVRGKIISNEEIFKWKINNEIPTIFSTLQECNPSESKVGWMNSPYTITSQDRLDRGNDAEQKFLQACEKKGWVKKYIKDAQLYDYKYHVDLMIKIDKNNSNEEMWVDVKCCRSVRRGWAEQSEYLWVELNTSGWLFGGHATVIAQKMNETTFCLLDRQKLCDFVQKKVIVGMPVVPYPEQAFNRVYLREGTKNGYTTKNILSMVSTKEAFEECGCEIITI